MRVEARLITEIVVVTRRMKVVLAVLHLLSNRQKLMRVEEAAIVALFLPDIKG